MENALFFSADAHEGPVWVAAQARLYYATGTHLDGRRSVDIEYLDFSSFGWTEEIDFWEKITEAATGVLRPHLFCRDANMANGMQLGPDGRSLLVAEQGFEDRPAAISRIDLATGDRTVLADNFEGAPFNSPNKVLLTQQGHLIFSDPDYGFRQGFRPPPTLEPNLYIQTASGALHCFRCGLEMPHGLALSPDEKTLFVTDTSNEGAHPENISLDRRRSVWKFAFDPESGRISGPATCCFSVRAGVPDGLVVTTKHLLAAGGDGIYVADLHGGLHGFLPISEGAVNLALVGFGKHLFVTIDKGILLYKDWEHFVQPVN